MGFLRTTAAIAAGFLVTIGGCTALVWHRATGHMPEDKSIPEKAGTAVREAAIDGAKGVIGKPEDTRKIVGDTIKGVREHLGAAADGIKDGTGVDPREITLPSLPSLPSSKSDAPFIEGSQPVTPQQQVTPSNAIKADVPETPQVTCDRIKRIYKNLSETPKDKWDRSQKTRYEINLSGVAWCKTEGIKIDPDNPSATAPTPTAP